MEPVALIVSALIAGAVAGARGVGTSVAADAYAGLKTMVLHRFRGHPVGETALQKLEADPEAWRSTLTAELERVGAGADESSMVGLAQQLMAMLDVDGTRAGRYRVDARAAQGVQIGENGTQYNVFGAPPSV